MQELDTFNIARLIIAVLFIIMSIIVLARSRHMINYFFALTPLLVSVWAMMMVFFENSDVLWLRLMVQALFIAGPLGILISVLLIYYGSDVLRNSLLWFTIAVYILAGIVIGAWSLINEFSGETESMNIARGMYNLIICLPLFYSFYFFFQVQKEVPEQQLKIRLLLVGILFVVGGQLLNGVWYLYAGNFHILAFGMIIIGLLTSILSFVNIPFVQREVTS